MSLVLKILSKIFSAKPRKLTSEEKLPVEKILNDPGLFQYDETGFWYNTKQKKEYIKWDEIEKILCYKRDLMTFDLLCLAIFLEEGYLELSEEIPGWYQFINKISEVFPSIPSNWESEVLFPPFESKERVLYSRMDK